MSHVTRMNESWTPWHTLQLALSHVWVSIIAKTNEFRHADYRVMAHMAMRNTAHRNESCRQFEWVTLLSHGTYGNESCHTCEWVVSSIWVSRVTHMNESCYTWQWVMSHIRMSHVALTNESCREDASHIPINFVTHMNESFPHMAMSHVPHTNESWR